MKRKFYRSGVVLLVCLGMAGLMTAQQPETPNAERLFSDGLRLLKEKHYEDALAAFKQSAVMDDRQTATFANIGTVQMILHRFSKAETAFRTALRLTPTSGDLAAGLCLALSAQDKHIEAVKTCDDAVRLSPDSPYPRVAQIEANSAAGRDIQYLLGLIDLALGKFRSDEALLAKSVDIFIFGRNYAYAQELLQRLISIRPNEAKYHGRLAEVQLRLGDDSAALASARRALSLDGSNPYGNFAMGLIFFELGSHEDAVESFGRVPEETKYLRDAPYYLALSEARRGRSSRAIEILEPLVEAHPNEVTYIAELARNLGSANRHREAISAYSKANELSPKTADLLAGLGMAYMSLADFENAIRYFDAVLELKPGHEFYQMFANVARARQQLPGRIDQIVKYVESRPKDIRARIELAKSLAFLNRADEAEKYIQEIYALDPPEPEVYQHLGVAYSEAGLEDKALDAYRRSLQKGEYEGAYLGIAGIMEKRGQTAAAAAAYEKIIELKPNVPNIMIGYANLLRDSGKRREALAMYRRSLALQPSNAIALFNAGILSMKLGEPDVAATYLESLRPLDPVLASRLERCIKLRIWG